MQCSFLPFVVQIIPTFIKKHTHIKNSTPAQESSPTGVLALNTYCICLLLWHCILWHHSLHDITYPHCLVIGCLCEISLDFKLLKGKNYVYLNAQCLGQSFLSHNKHSTHLLLNEWIILGTSLSYMPHGPPILKFNQPSKYFSNSISFLYIHYHHSALSYDVYHLSGPL